MATCMFKRPTLLAWQKTACIVTGVGLGTGIAYGTYFSIAAYVSYVDRRFNHNHNHNHYNDYNDMQLKSEPTKMEHAAEKFRDFIDNAGSNYYISVMCGTISLALGYSAIHLEIRDIVKVWISRPTCCTLIKTGIRVMFIGTISTINIIMGATMLNNGCI